MIHLEKRECYVYPDSTNYFSPNIFYPEYPFSEDTLGLQKNEVYDMVRASLFGLGLDVKHYGSRNWNPLGDYISPGAHILIKPNLVIHNNAVGGLDCTVTHPSIIRCIIDYCIIAKAGKITVGDAPIQSCDFEKLLDIYEYNRVLTFFSEKGFFISIADFRMTITKSNIRGTLLQEHSNAISANETIEFDLKKNSNFNDLPDGVRYRITHYNHKRLNTNHDGNHHKYLINKSVFDCDLIINLPKPKTHRFAGITGAQKNFIGVCSDKEYLPHFRIGTPDVGGDQSNYSTMLDKVINSTEEQYCKYVEKRNITMQMFYKLFQKCLRIVKEITRNKKNKYFQSGQWYGNDTIWRTVLDINLIVLYGNTNGVINFYSRPKSILTIGDMIIAGEREGPLDPSPKPLGIILASNNCAVFDYIFCKITGFDNNFIPTIRHSLSNHLLLSEQLGTIYMSSNLEQFRNISVDNIIFPEEWVFLPNSLWEDVLNNAPTLP
jgi:uncharacterized protein (DUF362 family)